MCPPAPWADMTTARLAPDDGGSNVAVVSSAPTDTRQVALRSVTEPLYVVGVRSYQSSWSDQAAQRRHDVHRH